MAVNFKTNYLSIYGELMAEAIKDGTPYKQSINYLSEQFDNFNISDKEKATLTAQYMANVTNAVTIQAMQLAMGLTDKDLKADNEIAMQQIQKEIAEATKPDKIAISGWQKDTAEENYNYAKEKAIALPESVTYNNWIKGATILGDWLGQHKLGGGTIDTSMTVPIYETVKALMLSETSYTFSFDPDNVSQTS